MPGYSLKTIFCSFFFFDLVEKFIVRKIKLFSQFSWVVGPSCVDGILTIITIHFITFYKGLFKCVVLDSCNKKPSGDNYETVY